MYSICDNYKINKMSMTIWLLNPNILIWIGLFEFDKCQNQIIWFTKVRYCQNYYFLFILVLAQEERACDRKMMSYRTFALFCTVTFRSIRICPNHTGRMLCFEVLSFRLQTVGFMGSIYHAPMHPGVYHPHGGWRRQRRRWENSRSPVFSPIQNT